MLLFILAYCCFNTYISRKAFMKNGNLPVLPVFPANDDVLFLCEHGHYFGSTGAIAYFERKYSTSVMHNELDQGRVALTSSYLDLLSAAMLYVSTFGIVSKIIALSLLVNINFIFHVVKKTCKVRKFQLAELGAFMVADVRILQLLQNLSLTKILFFVRKSSEDRFENHYRLLKEFSQKDDSEHVRAVVNLADALRWQLANMQLVHMQDMPTVRNNVWIYAVSNERTEDLVLANMVMQIFQAIDHHADALLVKKKLFT